MALINTTTTGILGTTVYGDGAGALTVQQDGVQIAKVTKSPAFYSYLSSAQTITTGTWYKVSFATKLFDTDNCFDSTTNYRFTPNVAGYYQLNLTLMSASTTPSLTRFLGSISINGDYGSNRVWDLTLTTTGQWCMSGSVVRYFNGTTDYAEAYTFATGTGTLTVATEQTKFNGILIKAV